MVRKADAEIAETLRATKDAADIPLALAAKGSNSVGSIQNIGPKPIEKLLTYMIMPMSTGVGPAPNAKKTAVPAIDRHIPANEARRSGRLPTVSTRKVDISIAQNLQTPMRKVPQFWASMSSCPAPSKNLGL
eukprot:gnl/MRDRNA2_/MRDRNA2_165261_c0_seq1.p2 gnl/MRDRNA2_/MRDRNA2_165261_c0~~gnl/MRDRNA2_/MRDRNA2_165261_c0_seq1.p2  ORF type:complete len:132 (+),score=19.60 gnl/MRDRNA2_/MRDRNA2_165261_c0_seq1:2-397(+)